jgi:hypothetical protein
VAQACALSACAGGLTRGRRLWPAPPPPLARLSAPGPARQAPGRAPSCPAPRGTTRWCRQSRRGSLCSSPPGPSGSTAGPAPKGGGEGDLPKCCLSSAGPAQQQQRATSSSQRQPATSSSGPRPRPPQPQQPAAAGRQRGRTSGRPPAACGHTRPDRSSVRTTSGTTTCRQRQAAACSSSQPAAPLPLPPAAAPAAGARVGGAAPPVSTHRRLRPCGDPGRCERASRAAATGRGPPCAAAAAAARPPATHPPHLLAQRRARQLQRHHVEQLLGPGRVVPKVGRPLRARHLGALHLGAHVHGGDAKVLQGRAGVWGAGGRGRGAGVGWGVGARGCQQAASSAPTCYLRARLRRLQPQGRGGRMACLGPARSPGAARRSPQAQVAGGRCAACCRLARRQAGGSVRQI